MSQSGPYVCPRVEPVVSHRRRPAHGIQVGPVSVEARAYALVRRDGTMARDQHAASLVEDLLEDVEPALVVGERVRRAALEVEQRDLDVREHVTGDEDSVGRHEERRVPRSVPLVLEEVHVGSRPVEGVGVPWEGIEQPHQGEVVARCQTPGLLAGVCQGGSGVSHGLHGGEAGRVAQLT